MTTENKLNKGAYCNEVRVVCMECWKFKFNNNVIKIGNNYDICKMCMPKFLAREKKILDRNSRIKKDRGEVDATWMNGGI